MAHDLFNTLQDFEPAKGLTGKLYSLPALAAQGFEGVSRLPVSIRIVLESVLRNFDGQMITEGHVKALAQWAPGARRTEEVPFVVARIVLQDFTGVPLLCDLAAMRGAVSRMGGDPSVIEPRVPVDLVVDHSVQVDSYGGPDSLKVNMQMEFKRNSERYKFLKWGMGAFDMFKVVPPGSGIVHQVNLEHLARGVCRSDKIYYPDTLVGTDSHTTMINALGVVGWGVGGIEAEAGMLGQPIYFLTPDVVGVNLTGVLGGCVNATDMVLTVTELLRREGVVGAFVEFFGEGTETLTLPDRATIANMSPEYGATMAFFPVDDTTVEYLRTTGRTGQEVEAFAAYFKAQRMYGIPMPGEIDYTRVIELDLSTIVPSVAGPRRPQDRIELKNVKRRFKELFTAPADKGGFSKGADELDKPYSAGGGVEVRSGDVIISAITSCTNTSNPYVMLAAGLLAKKAVQKGLTVKGHIKTSLAPGSRVVTDYLEKSGLLTWLEQLGFYNAAYGCTTCIGNAGPLDEGIEDAIVTNGIIGASVLSGNRNFEARIHPNLHASFLMSPPLVVAFAIAGTMLIDMENEPLGMGADGQPVYLRDIWPAKEEVAALIKYATDPENYRYRYSDFSRDNEIWEDMSATHSKVYGWGESTYIAEPPFFEGFSMEPPEVADISGARVLGIFGDSFTTDHISPAGPIKDTSPAGRYLIQCGVRKEDFQSYGTRRGNHGVMVRGTFANVRIKNLMLPAREDGSRVEGGITLHQPSGEEMSIYDAAMRYSEEGVQAVVFGGEEYGTGSSRDWAAKGTLLLGVRAVIARSYERIHRSNLIGMGVLPLEFRGADSVESLNIRGDEEISISGLNELKPQQEISMTVKRSDGSSVDAGLLCRIDTPIEVDYFRHGGILPYVLRQLAPGA